MLSIKYIGLYANYLLFLSDFNDPWMFSIDFRKIFILNRQLKLWNGRTFQIFGNNAKESKFHSGRNEEQTEVTECLLSFGAVSSVFQFDVQNFEDQDTEKCNFACFFYVCETWSLTWKEKHRLRVFEKSVLRRIFGPKRDEVTGEWRKVHNEELSDLYSSPNIVRVFKSRRVRWAGHAASVGG
jgi:hypothetical protein